MGGYPLIGLTQKRVYHLGGIPPHRINSKMDPFGLTQKQVDQMGGIPPPIWLTHKWVNQMGGYTPHLVNSKTG